MLVWPPLALGELKDYDINWLPRLGADTIAASVWEITGSNTTPPIAVTNTSFSTTRTKAWLSGGVVGYSYVLKNTVTTAAGDTLIEDVSVLCVGK